jgi:holo-[acyl-carrier protein] synthase
MMIGIGNDLLQISRMAATYERTQGRIASRILGPLEYAVFQARFNRNRARGMAYLCTRFAAKEAFSKAIGLGMHMPMTWRSVQILNEASGKPYLLYSGLLANWMQERGWVGNVTLTDEQEMVSAVVIVTRS